MSISGNTERALHAVGPERVAERLVELACQETGARHGAVFLWDAKRKSLVVDFHIVEGVSVALPGHGVGLKPRADGRPNGIALTCFLQGRTYQCNDTRADPNYARYFLDVGSVLAVPIPWQGKALGVLTVSSTAKEAFTEEQARRLEQVAAAAAKLVRRAQLARASRDDSGRPFVIKGLSPEWLEVERRVEKVSPTDAPVLVTGESGTGKDLVARSIHFNSRRAHRAFVTVNCAAIPENLLESVLFGHVRGAFTGATFHKVGEFEKAHGGTLFLDELGELPLGLQAKVLRAVEQGEVTPLGSNETPKRVDVRLVCATNRELPAMVRAGTFRDDLYFRVSVMTIELPPLRSYKDNLEILSLVFLQQAAQRHARAVTSLSPAALALLHRYPFPGNVRELKNALEHAVIMCGGDEVQPQDLPKSITQLEATPETAAAEPAPEPPQTLEALRQEWLAPLEKRYLTQLLERCDGRVREAARQAGVNPVTFYRLMDRHGLRVRRGVEG